MSAGTWKVVATDNFDRETKGEWVPAGCYGLSKAEAVAEAARRNAAEDDMADWYFVAKPSGYELFKWKS